MGYVLITIVLLVFPAWARGGNIREFLTPYPWLAAIAFFVFLLAPYLRKTSHSHGCTLVRYRVQRIFSDPVFYLGGAFLFQLYIQWWNSGKVRILLEEGQGKVTFSPPYIDWLPGAVDTLRSWDIVVWFFPAFVALLIIRHGFSKPQIVKIFFWGMIINASSLSIFGLIAPVLAKNYPIWLTSILPRQPMFFFSTFGYPNHAGSFFILHLGLACGLFFHYYKDRKQFSQFWVKISVITCIILLLFITIHLTACRYAILFSWAVVVFFLFYLLYKTFKNKPTQHPLPGKILIAAFCLLVLVSCIFFFLSNKDIHSEISTMSNPGKVIGEQFNSRAWAFAAAAKMWKDYPVFGVGGNGYREYLSQYAKIPKKGYVCLSNVHNDVLQFLCEFGIAGLGLMLGIIGLLAVRIARFQERKNAWVFFGLLGVFGVAMQSMIDVPFRSPPIIIAFVVVLAGYGMLPHDQGKVTGKKGSVSRFVTRFVNFYSILFLFVSIILWLVFTPIRQKASRDIVRDVEREYYAKFMIPRYDNITPGKSQNASPAMLRSLWWAKLLYSEYKDLHLLSAKINFDLYRNAKTENKKDAGSYLKEAFRSSLAARRFTTYADIKFVKVHAAILDALGYYLEESWCLRCFRKKYPKDIRVNLLVREYYFRRPYLYR
jgi:O-antigen ligase